MGGGIKKGTEVDATEGPIARRQEFPVLKRLNCYDTNCCKYIWVNKVVVGSSCRDAPKYVGRVWHCAAHGEGPMG